MRTKFFNYVRKTIYITTAFLFMVTAATGTLLIRNSVNPVYAASCGAFPESGFQYYGSYSQLSYLPSYYSYLSYMSKVGGVSLDQAATFLANMSDVTGAYFDQSTNRIVFFGPHNTGTPVFNKDDLAVAIRSVVFNNTLPAVNINAPSGSTASVDYYGQIDNTNFGSVLEQTDYKLKQYTSGYDTSGNSISSSVSGYRSVINRFFDNNPQNGVGGTSRFWISPQNMTLQEDASSNSFIFSQAKMQVSTQPLSQNNNTQWNSAASDFAAEMTNDYDSYIPEIPLFG